MSQNEELAGDAREFLSLGREIWEVLTLP